MTDTAAGRRRPADQPVRRHHELRADGARPSDARLRSGDARRAASCASGARRPARRITTLDGVDAEARAGHARHRRRASARRRSPASWAAPPRRSRRRRRTVAFESAYFKPASVRRTSKRLGLKTEASARFERGADINAPGRRACSARVALMRADRRRPRRRPRRRSLSRAARPRSAARCGATGSRWLLGLTVPDADVERILRGLGLDGRTDAPTAGTSWRRRSASICCARSISSRKSAGTTASTSSSRRSRR